MSEVISAINAKVQPTAAAARAAADLRADAARAGQLIHVADGRYKEIDEALLLPTCAALVPWEVDEDGVYAHMLLARHRQAAAQSGETPESSTGQKWKLA